VSAQRIDAPTPVVRTGGTAPAIGEPRRPPRPRRPRWSQLLPSLLPGLLMLVIGRWWAGRPVLSWDEIATMDVARRSPGQIWHLVHSVDAVFGPYYFFMHFWTSLAGSTDVALRLPSIIAMAGAVAVAGELGGRLFSPLVGVMTGLFLCLLPNISNYAFEARPYAFACLFSTLAFLLLYRALERPRLRRWLAYGLAVVFLGFSHVVALTTLAAHLGVVAFRLRDRWSWRLAAPWSGAVCAALLVLTPMAWLGLRQQHEQITWVPPLTTATLRAAPGDIAGSVPAGWLVVGLALIAAWRPRRHLAEVALLAAAPVITVAAVSVIGSPLWVPRYLLVVLAPTAMLAATATVGALTVRGEPERHRHRRGAVPAVRLIVILALVGFAAYPDQLLVRGATAKNGSDYRGAAAVIRCYEQPGDGVVYQHTSRTLRAGIDHYLSRDPGRPRDLLVLQSAAERGSLTAEEYPDAAARVQGVHRLWLLVTRSHSDPTTMRADLRTVLRAQYRRIGLWHLNSSTLALFVQRSSAGPAVPAAPQLADRPCAPR
jgi:mannosyltransferase